MIITLKATRIYASSSQFGTSPRTSLQAEPLHLSDFPRLGERAFVRLGEPVESVVFANKVRFVVGKHVFFRFFTGHSPSPQTDDAAIETEIQSRTSPEMLSSDNWYITLITERDVEVPDELTRDSKYLWLDPERAIQLERSYLPYATKNFDLLAAYLTSFIEPIFFERVAMDDRVFFISPKHEPFGLPRLSSGSAGVSITRSINALDVGKIESRLRAFAAGPQSRHSWLHTLSHWRLAALHESDPLRSFLWAFLALEILAHKMAPVLYPEVIAKLMAQPTPEPIGSLSTLALSQLVVPRDQLTLKARFALLPLALSPADADQDIASFAAAKKARDRFSHGDITDINELPAAKVNSLLQKYFILSINHQIAE